MEANVILTGPQSKLKVYGPKPCLDHSVSPLPLEARHDKTALSVVLTGKFIEQKIKFLF